MIKGTSIVFGEEGCGQPYVVSTRHRTCRLWMTKGANNHKVCPRAIKPSGHDSRIETFLRSRSEDADISGKGADDNIGLCVSTGSLASRRRKVQITIRCVRVLPNPWVTIAELRLFRGLGRKMLTSLGRVQMTTLVFVCQRDCLPLVD